MASQRSPSNSLRPLKLTAEEPPRPPRAPPAEVNDAAGEHAPPEVAVVPVLQVVVVDCFSELVFCALLLLLLLVETAVDVVVLSCQASSPSRTAVLLLKLFR